LKQTTDTASNVTATTSGRSWVTGEGLIRNDQKVTAFIHLNFENLKRDMALGHGEYLASLGTLLGIPNDSHRAFFSLTQDQYSRLVDSHRSTPIEVLAALDRTLGGFRPGLSRKTGFD
jgi:hypothetical protein